VLIYVDTSDVRDGALAELKWAIEELAAYVGNAQRRMLPTAPSSATTGGA
jgi:hypothetical protein